MGLWVGPIKKCSSISMLSSCRLHFQRNGFGKRKTCMESYQKMTLWHHQMLTLRSMCTMSFWTLWHVAYIEDFQQMRELLILITLAKLRQMGSLVQLFKTSASVSLNLIMESLYMEPEVELENTACSCCKNSAICVSLILSQYNLLTDAYHIIGLAYKFLLTISITDRLWEKLLNTEI